MDKIKQANELIEAAGGHAQLSAALGYEHKGGSERVNNWRTRGIPSQVIIDNWALFQRLKKKVRTAA